MATNPEQLSTTPGIEQHEDGITILWDTDHSSFYHYFWLRSACHCDLCGDSYTGSRRLHPSDVPIDIRPIAVTIDDQLKINWQPDQHASEYDFAWLREYAYDGEYRQPEWHPRLWDGSLDPEQVSYNLDKVKQDQLAYLDFLRTLRDYGIAIMRCGTENPAGIENMASIIGEISDAAYSKVFDLKPDKNAHTYGNTTQVIPPHTDEAYLHTPTGILVLYCLYPAADGGESILVDGFQIATRLKEENPEAFKLLATCQQTYHRIVPESGMDFRTRTRALNVDERGNLVGFRFHPRSMAPNDLPGNLARLLHAANFALSELMLQQQNQLCFQLQAGDAVFFDNHRVMHSRKGFNDLKRHLQICNVSRDMFHQQLRLTARQQGFIEEANQYLPAGVSG